MSLSNLSHRLLNRLNPPGQQARKARSELIEGYVSGAKGLAKDWEAGRASELLHANLALAGLPVPYGLEAYPHAVFASIHNTYAPWLRDAKFQAYLDYIKPPCSASGNTEKTLVDIYRCWTLWQVSQQLAHSPGNIFEVGVYKGGTAALFAHSIKESADPHTKLYLFDTFRGVAKAGQFDTAYKGGEHSDTSVESVRALVSRFIAPDRFDIRPGLFPEDSTAGVDNIPIKLAHVDVDVFQSTVDAVNWIWPRLIHGGFVIVDDYGLQGTEGVTRACEQLAAGFDDCLLIYNFNGQGMLCKYK